MKNKKTVHLLSIVSALFFFGLGFLVTNILNTKLSQQKQSVQSHAAGPIQEPQCTSQGGECQTGLLNSIGKPCTLSNGNPGIVKYNLCPQQENDIRCCVATAVQQPQSAQVDLAVNLQGILPNQNIQTPQRAATIKIYDNKGDFTKPAFTAQDTLTYDASSGNFVNPNFNLGSVTSGDYQMVVQMDGYLDSELTDKTDEDNNFSLDPGAKVQAEVAQMRAGDLAPVPHGDNFVDVIDYNALIGCMPGAPESACLNRKHSDLNDDGIVDQKDLDLLLLNFGDTGFEFQTNQFKCEPDPTCNTGKGSLQLCSLLCTKKSLRG